MMKILFVCEGNVNRSQMAGTMFKHFLPRANIQTAGTIADNAGKLVSEVIEEGITAMRERGFDMSLNRVTRLTHAMVEDADRIILMEPIMGGPIPEYLKNSKKLQIWHIPDPGYGQITTAGARDMILKKVKQLVFRIRLYRFLGWSLGCLIVFVVAVNVTIHQETKPYIYNNIASVPNAEVALIPGAAILLNGGLSPIFVDRVDMTIKLYEAKKVSKIIVSGDNSTLSHNEVNPVRNYLLAKGIPDEDIFLDHAGFDTYSTMYRARDIFGVSSVLITTQSFHLPRAVFIARQLGMNASGMNADVGRIFSRNYIREALANEKAILDLMFQRKPKYLGEKIPITGDGRNYP
ncbi:MAG: ElyC/SanA/YdcF family protein [bacterium]|nr:ElyC/SanA/YdcF family protein [bacterium]